MSIRSRDLRALSHRFLPPTVPLEKIREEGSEPVVGFTAACKEQIRKIYQEGQAWAEHSKVCEQEYAQEVKRLNEEIKNQEHKHKAREGEIITHYEEVVEQLNRQLDECRDEVTATINELIARPKSLLNLEKDREMMKTIRYYRR